MDSNNYNYCIVGDGDQALDYVDEHRPEIIVLDIMMPRVDGYEVLRGLRDRNYDGKVLVATAKKLETKEEIEIRGYPFVAGILKKPFGIKEFLDEINGLIGD